jgi:hypothetical protein
MIQPFDHDEVDIHFDADPASVYALVADVTRMVEFSPELLEIKWLVGATEAAVGVRFAARNKVSHGPAWTNKPVITVVEPNKEFAFERTEPFGGTVEWRYRFEPEGSGTRMTESYRVVKPIGHIGWFIIGTVCKQKGRREIVRRGMEETLQRMKQVVEARSDAPATP